jgi:hypothetical protein
MAWYFVILTGAIGAVVGGLVQYARDRQLADYTLRLQHKHEERKKLRELESRYMGRMLEAALDWDRRMTQIYKGAYKDLDPPDEERTLTKYYYFHSVIFRFLQLTAIARRFEAEAFYIDPEIVATPRDFDLLRYAKAFLWVMIHAELSPDDGLPGKDHFRSDAFRPLLDLCYGTPEAGEGEKARPLLPETRSRDDELIFDLRRFWALLALNDPMHKGYVDELLGFFDGVRPDDHDGERQRRRWDRLVALHLLCLAFIDTRGYAWHHRNIDDQARTAIGMLLYPDNLWDEFVVWLPRLGLGADERMNRVRSWLEEAAKQYRGQPDAERERRVLELVESNGTRPEAGEEAVSAAR